VSSEQLGLDAAGTLAVCAAVGVGAVIVSDLAARRLPLPAVVLEIVGGILVGPDVLGLADDNVIVSAYSELGLLMLMFLAGYEIQVDRIKGAPLRSAVVGWATSLALGLAAGITLVSVARPEDTVSAGIVVGLIFTTTALGTVLPILRDSGDLDSRFGTFVLSAGAVGEFGPILAIALFLSGDSPLHTTIVLLLFGVVVVVAIWAAARGPSPHLSLLLARTLGTSGQLGVRVVMLVVLLLTWVAAELDLDVLLGAFVAGLVMRIFLASLEKDVEHGTLSRVEGAGFGFLVPIFFVVSGIRFDLAGLLDDPEALVLVPIALVLFLVIRGLPAYAALRGSLTGRDRTGAAVYIATALPLVVVITGIGVDEGTLTTTTAAALTAGGILSVLLFPLTATHLRGITRPVSTDGWRDDSDGL
jgi:Kef-type K+ transport system membrane component KefB